MEKYIEYTTLDGTKYRAVVLSTNVEVYQLSLDLWNNSYWRFLMPISKELLKDDLNNPNITIIMNTLEGK